jgi:hypothetical protein
VAHADFIAWVEGLQVFGKKLGIGWAFAHHLGAELVAAALAMALAHRRPPEGLVHLFGSASR